MLVDANWGTGAQPPPNPLGLLLLPKKLRLHQFVPLCIVVLNN